MLKSIDSLGSLAGKTVLVRVNFDVAKISDWRIEQSMPLLKELARAARRVIILSHRGRPQGRDERLSLRPVFEYLKERLGNDVVFESGSGKILLLENLRFDPREEQNDDDFARELAALGDVYINNDFATSHRAHASIVGIPRLIPSAAGPLLIKEAKELSAVSQAKAEPLVFLLAGAKPETKLPVIRNFLDKADTILLGGVLANTFFKAKGLEVGKSIVGDTAEVSGLLENPKIVLPVDVMVSKSLESPQSAVAKKVSRVEPGEYIVDIGPETQRAYGEILGGAARTIWNGALGRFEVSQFAAGSRALARAIVQSAAHATVGGGDTIDFLDGEGLLDQFDFVSTGGGAMLAFLAGEKLPGLEVLEE